jgi:ABC-type siderophore export system fused ATPase/permease subunit
MKARLMPQIRDHLIHLTIIFIGIIYLAFFMGQIDTWWAKATLLVSVLLAILQVILMLQTLTAFYTATEGDCKSWRIEELENEVTNLKIDNKKQLKLISNKNPELIRKDLLYDVLDKLGESNASSWRYAEEIKDILEKNGKQDEKNTKTFNY